MKDGQTIGQWLKWDFKTDGTLVIRNTNGIIYLERHNGYWEKREFNSQGLVIYYENSNVEIIDMRPPKIIEHNGRKYQLIP